MEKIEVQILGISSGHTNTSYTLILEEVKGDRKLPIIIGSFEAQAIAIEIEKIVPVRPMTHDLFKTFMKEFSVTITEVIIHRLHDGVFYSSMVCNHDGRIHKIDARTSDAIALALRFNCPIYTYENILDEAGIVLTDTGAEGENDPGLQASNLSVSPSSGIEAKSESKEVQSSELATLSLKELNAMLEEAIEEENYALAAKIRDELKKKQDS